MAIMSDELKAKIVQAALSGQIIVVSIVKRIGTPECYDGEDDFFHS